MKTSPFVKPFEQDVDRWERTLSHILEGIEALLLVQRQWLYLEVQYSCFNEQTFTRASKFSHKLETNYIIYVSMCVEHLLG